MEQRLVSWKSLLKFVEDVLIGAGLNPQDAHDVAEILVEADLRGVNSHGVIRLGIYVKQLQTEVVNASGQPFTADRHGVISTYDGDNAMGQVVSKWVMNDMLQNAGKNGCAIGFVRNSNHAGICAYYTEMAAKAGMFGVYMTNTFPSVAPWGGRSAVLGTNPLSMAFPGPENPIVLDMATSQVAKGKILEAKSSGKSIPEGWALDAMGKPTTDPSAALAGVQLPFGGSKGYGLGLFIELLSGVMTGANFGSHIHSMYSEEKSPQNIGHFIAVIDLKAVGGDTNSMLSRTGDLCSQVTESAPAEGFNKVMLPGEPERLAKEKHLNSGIPVNAETWASFENFVEKFGVTLPSRMN